MFKKGIRIVAYLLAILIVFSVSTSAIELRSSEYLGTYYADLLKTSDGDLSIYFSITAPSRMDYLGANRIYIQRYTGSYWTTEYTFTYPETLELQGESTVRYSKKITYDPVYSSAQYRAVVTFYAAKGSGSDTGTYTTNSVS